MDRGIEYHYRTVGQTGDAGDLSGCHNMSQAFLFPISPSFSEFTRPVCASVTLEARADSFKIRKCRQQPRQRLVSRPVTKVSERSTT